MRIFAFISLQKGVVFFLWCLERGACKSKVEMLQNKQGHTKKPDHYYLFFFLSVTLFLILERIVFGSGEGKVHISRFLLLLFIFFTLFFVVLKWEGRGLDALPRIHWCSFLL